MTHVHRNWVVALFVALFPSVLACNETSPTKPAITPQVFNDDFNGTAIDATKWNLSLGDGTATFSGGYLTLSSPDGVFPYLTSNANPFPTQGDFVLTVGFRYLSAPGAGNGFGPDWTNRGGFWVWQDVGSFTASVGDSSITLTLHDYGYHVFEWRYVGGVYSLTIDGQSKGNYRSAFRPTSIFFGHPTYASSQWATQQIDFVHIEPLTIP